MPEFDANNEKNLLTAIKNGDKKAFEQLYHQYKRLIYHNIYKLVHIHEVTEELTQDVFIKIWQQREMLAVEKSFPAFLYRIAGNLTIDFYRRAAQDKKLRENLMQIASEFYNPLEVDITTRENVDKVQSAMRQLPPRRREVFTLCKLEGRSYLEVAALLGISAGTVNDHIVKATKFLRKELMKNNLDFYLVFLLIALSF